MRIRLSLCWFSTSLALVALVAGIPENSLGQGAIIWNGPTISYTQPSPDPTQAQNQDHLTDAVWLTRGTSQGLFNAAVENVYSHDFSPAGTEWAYGILADYASLTYHDWETWNGASPPSMVGQPAVLHLIADNIYLSIEFTSWGVRSGGFTYVRSTPLNVGVPEPSAWSILAGGLIFAFLRRHKLK